MDDLISRQAAIEAVESAKTARTPDGEIYVAKINAEMNIQILPSVQPETSRIEQELHGKTPEEQYEFLYWLLLKFGLAYTDSRLAVIEWLRGEKEDG